jgi:redox-sensing transcriptional repressor
MTFSEKVIERLSQYRRLLNACAADGTASIFSHELAEKVGGTAAQVRRDIMTIGYSGHPKRGYDVTGLTQAIADFLDNPAGDAVILIGMGNLGRALLPFFATHRQTVRIVAAFDTSPMKTGRVIHGCRCHDGAKLESFVKDQGIRIAILAIPATKAQRVTDRLVEAGITGILNFAPTHLRTPKRVWVENIDMTVAMEKVSYLARSAAPTRDTVPTEGVDDE